MSKFDKYFKEFDPEPEAGPPGNESISTADLSAMEQRINKHMAESISRLEDKLKAAYAGQSHNDSTHGMQEPTPADNNDQEDNENV